MPAQFRCQFGFATRLLAFVAAWPLAIHASAGPQVPGPGEANVVESERARIDAYTKQLDETNRLVAAKQAEIARLDRETETLERLLSGAKRRIGLGGSETVGTAFLRELIRVREARSLIRVSEADRTSELDLELRGLDLADRTQELGQLESAIAERLDDAAIPAGDGRTRLAEALRPILVEQRDVRIGPLLEANRTAIETLEKLEAAQARLIATIEDYRAFIMGNLLWLRVTEPSGPVRLGEGAVATVELLARAPWASSFDAVSRGIAADPIPWIALVGSLGVLLAVRPRCRRALEAIAARVHDGSSDRFLLSLEATLATLVLAAPLPLAAGFLLRTLTAEGSGDLLSAAVGSGFYRNFPLFLLVAVTLALTRRDGLAAAHFGWHERARRTARRFAWILLAVVAPTQLVAVVLILGIDAGTAGAHASQTMLVVAALAWTVASASLSPPARGILAIDEPARGPWARRGRWIRFAILAGIPLFLLLAAWRGYNFAATVGMEKIASSLVVLLAVRIASELCLRWIAATTRSIERQREESPVDAAAATPAPAEPQDAVDLGATNLQAARIIGSIAFTALVLGVLAVWSDLLPALDGLKSIRL